MTRHCRAWTPAEDAALRRHQATQTSIAAVARMLDRSESSVRYRLDALAIDRPRRADGQTTRACLCCRKSFVSTGAHHRLCARCRTLSKTPFDF